jgi:hypothetical protein
MYSTVLNIPYDVGALRDLAPRILEHQTQNPFHLDENRVDMTQRIFLIKDLPADLQEDIMTVTPLPLDPEIHSVGIETVKKGEKVKLHKDWLMGWNNPLTRKTNIMFNLEDEPIEIIHDKTEHNKVLNPNQVMILDVTKTHGAEVTKLNKDFFLYTVNLRLSYDETVKLLSS